MGIGNFFGAFFRAGAAGDALFHIDESRALNQIDLKVALFATKVFDFAEREYIDIDMPADLDQFGRDNSHCTVIGREGLIQLRHHPSDGA